MDVRRFKTLLAVAECKTFAKAASAVNLTPAAVSQQMKSIESELGVSLFDRSRRPPALNPAGFALVAKARTLVRAYDDLVPSQAGDSRSSDQLTIGAVPTTMTGLMPRTLRALSAGRDNLHVRLYPGLSGELHAQVDRGFLDAAVISEPRRIDDQFRWRPFAREPFVILASPKVRIDDPLELLVSQPFIRFNRRAWVGAAIDDWLRESGIRVRETMELDTLEAISAMVYNDLGVSIVPRRCYAGPHQLPLQRIPVAPTLEPRILGLLSRHDTHKPRLMDTLYRYLLQVVETAGRVEVIHTSASTTAV